MWWSPHLLLHTTSWVLSFEVPDLFLFNMMVIKHDALKNALNMKRRFCFHAYSELITPTKAVMEIGVRDRCPQGD